MDTNDNVIIEVNKRKKKQNNILILSMLIVIVAVLALVITIIKSNSTYRDFVYVIHDAGDDTSLIYLNGKLIDTVEGKAELYDNMDGSGCYIQLNQESYYIEDNKLQKLDDGLQVYKLANHANVALAKDKAFCLYLITEDGAQKLTDEPVDYAVISGDGKKYAYNIGKDSYVGESPQKEIKVENVLITYMSDNGELIYGFEYESGLLEQFELFYEKQQFGELLYHFYDEYKLVMVDNKGSVNEIKDGVSGLLGLNATGTELMFIADDKTFVLEKGKKCTEVVDYVLEEYDLYCKETAEESSYGYRSIDSYKGSVIEKGDKVYLLKGKYKAVEVVSDCSSVLGLSKDLSRLLYISDYEGLSALCVVDVRVGAKPRVIETEVDNGVISLDGDEIYYLYLDKETGQNCLRYVDGNKEPETIYWIPVGDYSRKYLENVGDEIYANMGSTYYIKKNEVILAEGLINDYKYVVDKNKREEYVEFDYRLYKLSKVELTDEANNIVEKLEKRKLTNEEKIEKIEKTFKVDLPDSIEIKKYESSAVNHIVASIELNEEECRSIVEQYEGIQFDMLQYMEGESDNIRYMPISNWYDIQEIKYWYQIDSDNEENKVVYDELDLLFKVRAAKNVFICELADGKIIAVFGYNYDQPVSY